MGQEVSGDADESLDVTSEGKRDEKRAWLRRQCEAIRIVVLEDGHGALGEGELCTAVGTELLVEDMRGGLEQGASTTRTVGTQTEGAGGVTRLALDLALKHSSVDGRVVGAWW